MAINKLILFLVFLISTQSFAKAFLTMKADKTYGQIVFELNLAKNQLSYKTNSNIFTASDTKSFGSYIVSLEAKMMKKRLSKLSRRINSLNQSLLVGGSDLSKMYPVKGHELYIEFDGQVVSNANPFFKKLRKIVKEILSSNKKKTLMQVELHEDRLTVFNGKKKKVKKIDRNQICSGTALSGVCKIKDLGFISL